MAYSDVIIRQCGPRDADSDNDLRILWRMLKMMKTGFIRYLLAIIFMSAALSVFDMITALLFKNIIFRVENYAQRNMFAGLLKEVLLCAGIGCLMLFIYALSFYVYTMEAKKGGADLQKALYSKCMRLPYSYYEQTGSSEFMSKVINDCERAQGIYGSRFRRGLMPFLMISWNFMVTEVSDAQLAGDALPLWRQCYTACDKRLVYRTHAKSQLGNVHHQCIHCGTNFQYFVRHRAD